jgi:peptidyl-dipeptidase Dcp
MEPHVTLPLSDGDDVFLAEWSQPFALPPFSKINVDAFMSAFLKAMENHRQEIEAIAVDANPATFVNTLLALEKAGRMLSKVSAVFFNLTGAHTNDALQKVERAVGPLLSDHYNSIMLDERLYMRVAAFKASQEASLLEGQGKRLLDKTFDQFRRAGAGCSVPDKQRLAAIGRRLSELGTLFSQQVLRDESREALLLKNESDAEGLPGFAVDAAKAAAKERNLQGFGAITLARSSADTFLTFSTRRDLREIVWRAWNARGDNNDENDTKAIIKETLMLRAEKARLLGFESFAHFKLANAMAQKPETALNLLQQVWPLALARANEEAAALQLLSDDPLKPWDWRFYAQKRRQMLHNLDEAVLKPYFTLDAMILAAFQTASRLFGLRFEEKHGLDVYHADVRVWEVFDQNSKSIALFLGDYFARPSKRGGAWMSAFRGQNRLAEDARPIIVNVMNFSKSDPALLSFDDARTLFHEFGHALHGMLSDVDYPSLAGTNVARDFVELPSQLYEHWLEQPDILQDFARHYQTGEALSKEVIENLRAASSYNQGFATVEYTSCALLDLELHLMPDSSGLDVDRFEHDALTRLNMPSVIPMRHRLPHFTHVFSGDGYASGYYSYLWSETLDADAFEAFEESGDVFDADTAQKLKEFVYAAGDTRRPADAYMAFRGRLPSSDALLRKRGLL